jgi:phosphoribosylanthranilate isomerase
MSLWIKICANTSLADAMIAAEAGADAVGFVFAPSPRRVTREQAAAIVPHLPAKIEKIGVFVDASFDEIAATVEGVGLTGVQLHWGAPTELPARLRARFGTRLKILGVLHFDAATAVDVTLTFNSDVDATLVDSRTEMAAGGTGKSYDWIVARRALFERAEDLKLITNLIAAGGLTPDNVADAIATMRPWGVDVVSGVEVGPGRKDATKVRAFIEKARAAASFAG